MSSSSAGGGASAAPVTHVTESLNDRRKSRELAEARQSGAVAPEVDVRTGSMINPHNPEFITRRPWYLGGADEGPSLDHQADQRAEADRVELSLDAADRLVREDRERVAAARSGKRLRAGTWVEALRRNKRPWVICKVVKVHKRTDQYDLEYEDGYVEKRVRYKAGRANPRVRPTRTGNRSFAVDHAKHGKETFDSKRDRYHGYEASSARHAKLVEDKYAQRDALRRKIKAERKERAAKSANADKNNDDNNDGDKNKDDRSDSDDDDTDYDSDDDSDHDDDSDDSESEFVQHEDAVTFQSRLARQGGVGGAQMKVTARNLRIREDTAKYLRNLDLNSAYYDPKSRSMRDNPNPEQTSSRYRGDNASRIDGDAVGLARTQLFAWDATGHAATTPGAPAATATVGEMHPQADPSRAELTRREFDAQGTDEREERRRTVLERYGGTEHLDDDHDNNNNKGAKGDRETAEERRARFAATGEEGRSSHRRNHHNSGGNKTGGQRTPLPKQTSKYDEDVLVNGHTAVWGSYFHVGAFRWGYADDHSLIRNSYGTGLNGRKGNDDANEMRYGVGTLGTAAASKKKTDEKKESVQKPPLRTTHATEVAAAKSSMLKGSSTNDDAPTTIDEDKLRDALEKENERAKNHEKDDRKRAYNSSRSTNDEVTAEEMEAYRLKRTRGDDPMAKMGDSEQLLEY